MNFKSFAQGLSLLSIFIFVLSFIILGSQFLLAQNKSSALSSVLNGVDLSPSFPKRDWSIQDLNINAVSGFVVESNLSDSSKILYSKNGDIQLPIASLTKLMTAIIVLDNYNLSESITLDKKADGQAPMIKDVKIGDTLSIDEYLHIMLIESSNKSAFALAEKIGLENFIGLMNQKAKMIGLENTVFADPTGINGNNKSTARDLTKLAEYILKNYSKIVDISRIEKVNLPNFGLVENTNQLLGSVPEIVGGKTGFTTYAKGCLLLVVNNPVAGDHLFYVILGSDDRFLEMKNIIDWTNSAYKWK
jgi:D-alanyl-D-alanine carboxypeptidase